jgi:hypothetical protein
VRQSPCTDDAEVVMFVLLLPEFFIVSCADAKFTSTALATSAAVTDLVNIWFLPEMKI